MRILGPGFHFSLMGLMWRLRPCPLPGRDRQQPTVQPLGAVPRRHRAVCHNLSLDPDFRCQISDFWAKIYPRTRFLVRFQISDFTCPDQAPSHGPPTSFAGWRITRQSAICNLLEHNAKRKQPGRFRSQFASTRCPWAVLLTSEEHTWFPDFSFQTSKPHEY